MVFLVAALLASLGGGITTIASGSGRGTCALGLLDISLQRKKSFVVCKC
jgi:hypothetical protein